MAGSLTDTFEVDVLKAITAQTTTILTTTALAAVYVGLVTTTPSDSAAGTEVTGGAYARVDSKTKWAVPSAGSVATNAVLTFPTATADWGSIVGFNIYDAVTGGNRLGWGTFAVAKSVLNGDTPSFASGQLTITLD